MGDPKNRFKVNLYDLANTTKKKPKHSSPIGPVENPNREFPLLWASSQERPGLTMPGRYSPADLQPPTESRLWELTKEGISSLVNEGVGNTYKQFKNFISRETPEPSRVKSDLSIRAKETFNRSTRETAPVSATQDALSFIKPPEPEFSRNDSINSLIPNRDVPTD